MAGPWDTFMLVMRSQAVRFDDLDRTVLFLGLPAAGNALTDFSVDANHQWCMHGTSLSTAYKILFVDRAFRAGPATEAGLKGVFFIGPKFPDEEIDVQDSFQLARARAKCRLCTEWEEHGAPSVWSMPVCLMFQHPKEDTRTLHRYVCNASKQMIRRDEGTMVPLNSSVRLVFDIREFHAWAHVHQFTTTVDRPPRLVDRQGFDLVMCGGTLDDPVYWSRCNIQMDASCGRICRFQDLEANGWRHARNWKPRNARIYRCPKCHF